MTFARVLGMVFGALLTMSAQAYATPTLQFTVDGTLVATCADGDACDKSGSPNDGVVVFIGSLGIYSVNVVTGTTKPTLPVFGSSSELDLANFDISAQTGGTHTLLIEFSEVGYTSLLPFTLNGGGTTTGGQTVAASAYYSTANTLFDQATPICGIGPMGPGAFAGSCSGAVPLSGPYSLTQRVTFTTSTAGAFSGDFHLSQIPEPTSLLLFGGASLLLGLRNRRKAAKR